MEVVPVETTEKAEPEMSSNEQQNPAEIESEEAVADVSMSADVTAETSTKGMKKYSSVSAQHAYYFELTPNLARIHFLYFITF